MKKVFAVFAIIAGMTSISDEASAQGYVRGNGFTGGYGRGNGVYNYGGFNHGGYGYVNRRPPVFVAPPTPYFGRPWGFGPYGGGYSSFGLSIQTYPRYGYSGYGYGYPWTAPVFPAW